MAEGRSNQAICDALVVSPKTVEGHVRQIFMKLGLRETPDQHRRVQAVLGVPALTSELKRAGGGQRRDSGARAGRRRSAATASADEVRRRDLARHGSRARACP